MGKSVLMVNGRISGFAAHRILTLSSVARMEIRSYNEIDRKSWAAQKTILQSNGEKWE